MARQIIFNKFLILFSFINFSNLIFSTRNPFQPLKKNDEPVLKAIIYIENKGTVFIKYDYKNYILKENDTIEQKYKIKKIFDDRVTLINLENDLEKNILL